ncbi:MAG: HEAT repeat domain-containing protein [Bacillota bacterium]
MDQTWWLQGGASHAVSRAVAVALGGINDPLAVGPLSRALKRPDPHVCKPAAVAPGKTKDPRVVPLLGASLNDVCGCARGCRRGAQLDR